MTSPEQSNLSQGGSLWSDAWLQLRRNRMVMICLWIIVAYTGIALYGEGQYRYHKWKQSTPGYQVTQVDLQYIAPPLFRSDADIAAHDDISARNYLMGTDGLGRSVAQRLIQGTRIAFQVGIITSMIAIPIGLVLGLIAGYFGGRTDRIIVWIYSTFASIPGLLFILAIAMVVGKGLLGVYLGIGLTTWVGLCRLVRGEVIKHRGQSYIIAAQTLGLGHLRILFRHILPNILHLVIINFTYRFPAAINTEVILSFLGIGAQGEPSWGLMINSARLRLWHGVWWEMGFVTLAIFLVVLAFNLFGDALRDALDPRLKNIET
jgi:peptide/nickel transport system permease protein